MNQTAIMRARNVSTSEDLTNLFSQLNGFDTVPDVERINSLISEGSLAFYTVRDKDKIVGMASVIPCRTAASDKLWIEDVCVLEEYRGKGIGKQLLDYAMADAAKYFGKGTFWLTSRPSRTAARQMYKSMGFTEYETGVFFK